MQLPPLTTLTLELLSDLYHEHLRKSHISLKEHNLLPSIRQGDRAPLLPFGEQCVYLDQMRSAYNVGSILRTVEALRLGAVYFHENTPFATHDKVQKVSMGSAAIVPCYQISDLTKLPRPLIALETGIDAEPVSSFIFPQSCTLVIGNEEYGVSSTVLKEVDAIVEIPLFGKKNSINAACAFAIAAQAMTTHRGVIASC